MTDTIHFLPSGTSPCACGEVTGSSDFVTGCLARVTCKACFEAVEAALAAPVPMLLWCPMCHARHLDEGELATRAHSSHDCRSCGLTWTPAKVPTVGVMFLPKYKYELGATPESHFAAGARR